MQQKAKTVNEDQDTHNSSFMTQIRDYKMPSKLKDMCEMTVVQGLLDVANPNIEAARKYLETCRKRKKVIYTKRRKVTANILHLCLERISDMLYIPNMLLLGIFW